MDTAQKYSQFVESFSGAVKRGEPMALYTTYRTGGPADLFIDAVSAELLAEAIQLARKYDITCFVVGDGSNLLVSDSGYRGLIIRNRILGREVKGTELICGAGELLDRIVDYATDNSLTGIEFGAGIWGTIGGAIYGNAGAFGSQVSAILKSAELVDGQGDIRTVENAYFKFAYRHSHLKRTGEIVTRACFDLLPGDKVKIGQRTQEIRDLRGRKHPAEPCSAGCFFKNIEDPEQPHGKLPAGKLLEEAGAKNISVGKAAVFDYHANIIVNTGGAKSKDIRELADILKQKVKEKFNIELQEEVICLGEF